jgi:hypothetical protein
MGSNDPELGPRRTTRPPADASGYIYRKGRHTPLDTVDSLTTAHVAIDNRGQVVGQYVDAAGVLYGYLWEQGRGFRTIDTPLRAGNVCAEVPDVGRVCGTVAADINDRGEILLPAPGGRYKGRPPSIPPTIGG